MALSTSRLLKILAAIVTLACIAVTAVLLAPAREQTVVLPVDTKPIPELDRILDSIEKRLITADKEKKDYPGEEELKTWVPGGTSVTLSTGGSNLIILEISQNKTDWRSMTHERDKTGATTRVTIHRKPPEPPAP